MHCILIEQKMLILKYLTPVTLHPKLLLLFDLLLVGKCKASNEIVSSLLDETQNGINF